MIGWQVDRDMDRLIKGRWLARCRSSLSFSHRGSCRNVTPLPCLFLHGRFFISRCGFFCHFWQYPERLFPYRLMKHSPIQRRVGGFTKVFLPQFLTNRRSVYNCVIILPHSVHTHISRYPTPFRKTTSRLPSSFLSGLFPYPILMSFLPLLSHHFWA